MDSVYGFISGITGILLSHPIDTIKTRIQSNISLSGIKLYSGLASPLLLYPVEKSIVFGTTQLCKERGLGSFFSGAISGLACVFVVTPMEYYKIHRQNNMLDISFKKIYSGTNMTCVRESLGYGIYFSFYDYVTPKYNQERNLFKTFLIGGLTGSLSWLAIYPADRVKTLVQSNSINAMTAMRTIYNENNNKTFRNFFKGMAWAQARAFVLHAGVFLGYETSKKLFVY